MILFITGESIGFIETDFVKSWRQRLNDLKMTIPPELLHFNPTAGPINSGKSYITFKTS